MRRTLNRRDFLKLTALVPVVAASPYYLRASAQTAQDPNRPNVLVIVFDTLSAKHMSLYGYPRNTTPNVQRFANQATLFHRHYSAGNFTCPGTASLLTGVYPWTDRSFNFQATVTKEFVGRSIFRVFGAANYHRIAYTHNWLAGLLLDQFRADIDYLKPLRELCLADDELSDRLFPNDQDIALSIERIMTTKSSYGAGSLFLSQLWQTKSTSERKGIRDQLRRQYPRGFPTNENIVFVLEDAIDWIQQELRQAPRPFFAYFHLLPPHSPYSPRKEFIGRFDGDKYVEPEKPRHPLGTSYGNPNVYRKQYDENVAYADFEFGRLYDFLRDSGLLENTLVVFTSDHGEMLERHARGHMNPLLYEPIVRVPLIISSPGQKDHRDIWTPTSSIDLLPTLAQVAGQPVPAWAEGEILPGFGGHAKERSIFTLQAKSNAKQGPLTKATISLVKENQKLIYYLGYRKPYDDLFELYDLARDPEELTDLHASRSTSGDLENELRVKLEEVNQPYKKI